jgi:hypothetical protein
LNPPTAPPRWAEVLLERLLTAADRQTLVGDLREEFAEAVLPQRGRLRADLWYLRQVASLAIRPLLAPARFRRSLLLSSVFTLLCGCWLAWMESLLRHPDYLSRFAIDLGIAAVGLATLVTSLLHLGLRIERVLWAGAVALIAIGAQAFIHNATSANFEGFVLIVSLALIAQGALMLLSLGRPAARHGSAS